MVRQYWSVTWRMYTNPVCPAWGQVGRMEEDDVVQGIIVMRKGENPGEVIAALKDKIAELNKTTCLKMCEIVPFYDRENLVNLAVQYGDS